MLIFLIKVLKRLTIPSTRPCIWCPLVALVSVVRHAAQFAIVCQDRKNIHLDHVNFFTLTMCPWCLLLSSNCFLCHLPMLLGHPHPCTTLYFRNRWIRFKPSIWSVERQESVTIRKGEENVPSRIQ
jgi:hypothetical protein